MKYIIVLFVSFSVVPASAGRDVGNGADAHICGESVELYDIYEARVLRGFTFGFGGAKNLYEKIAVVLERIRRLDPEMYEDKDRDGLTLRDDIDLFMTKTLYGDFDLGNIDDSEHEFVGEGCELRQMVGQYKGSFSDKLYIVDDNLWRKLDENNQIAVLFHEVLYKRLSYQIRNSMPIRYLVSIFLAEQADKMTRTEYTLARGALGIWHIVWHDGYELFYWSLDFDDVGRIVRGQLTSRQTIRLKSGEATTPNDTWIELYETGGPKELTTYCRGWAGLAYDGQSMRFSWMKLGTNRQIQELYLSPSETSVSFQSVTGKYVTFGKSEDTFHLTFNTDALLVRYERVDLSESGVKCRTLN